MRIVFIHAGADAPAHKCDIYLDHNDSLMDPDACVEKIKCEVGSAVRAFGPVPAGYVVRPRLRGVVDPVVRRCLEAGIEPCGIAVLGANRGSAVFGDDMSKWPRLLTETVTVQGYQYTLPVVVSIPLPGGNSEAVHPVLKAPDPGQEPGVLYYTVGTGSGVTHHRVVKHTKVLRRLEADGDPTTDHITLDTLDAMIVLEAERKDRIVWVLAEGTRGERQIYPMLRSSLFGYFKTFRGDALLDFVFRTPFDETESVKLLPDVRATPPELIDLAEAVDEASVYDVLEILDAILVADPNADISGVLAKACFMGNAEVIETFTNDPRVKREDILFAADALAGTVHAGEALEHKTAGFRVLMNAGPDLYDPDFKVYMTAVETANLAFVEIYEEIRPIPTHIQKSAFELASDSDRRHEVFGHLVDKYAFPLEMYIEVLEFTLPDEMLFITHRVLRKLPRTNEMDKMLDSGILGLFTNYFSNYATGHQILLFRMFNERHGITTETFYKLMLIAIKASDVTFARAVLARRIFGPPYTPADGGATIMEKLLRKAYASHADVTRSPFEITALISQDRETTEQDIRAVVESPVAPYAANDSQQHALLSGLPGKL